ncbi:MAG: coenzyme F420-0:L-glutamate ligase [Clostridia bacterium]|nr:coenzyme F420-0:L-glutamate ligase [Clostridia bacterium]
MENLLGTISMGVRAPIIREGDNIAEVVATSVINASKAHGIPIQTKDVIAVTESVVARAEGNYVTVDKIAEDVKALFGNETIGVIFPILSRNRFAMCFKGICRAAKKVVLMLSFPADEVGNHLVSAQEMLQKGVSRDAILTEEKYREIFGYTKHEFTGVDYIEYYKELAQSENCEIEVVLANDCRAVMAYTKHILCADIHTREMTKQILKDAGASYVCGLDDICVKPAEGMHTGYNAKYGLLGSNKADEERVKLFPQSGEAVVLEIQRIIKEQTGIEVEAMVYGDGAFKDPVGKIWELADPVVSPAYTEGLCGRPNELKLKALADGKYAMLSGDALKEAIKEEIKTKGDNLVGNMASQGTTPRQITDLLGSLADLTSGSGDKGTPIIWIKGYFKNYADEA